MHGDLRPAHLWMKREDSLLVGDFLLPALAQPTTRTPDVYRAPELTPDQATPAGDQYALAVLVSIWLAGRPPAPAASEQSANVNLEPGFLRGQAPTIPQAVEEAVKRALNPDPVQRFPSVQDFANALQEAIQPSLALPPAASLTLTATTAPKDMPTAKPDLSPPSEPPPAKPSPPLPASSAASSAAKEESLPPFRWPDDDQLSMLRKPLGSAGAAPQPERRPVSSIAKGLSALVLVCAVIRLCIALGSLLGAHQSTTASSLYDYPAPTTTLLTYQGHHTAVYFVAWSPDGKAIASGDAGGSVNVWNALTGSAIYLYTGHSKNVWAVSWEPDGTRLASASEDETVQIWRLE